MRRFLVLSLCLSWSASDAGLATAASPSEEAWKALIRITTGGGVQPRPGESPAAWRLWSTQQEVYVHQGMTPLTQSLQSTYRDFNCQDIQQKIFFKQAVSRNMKARTSVPSSCEVVFLNPDAADSILRKQSYIRQRLYAEAKKGLKMPAESEEIKTLWRPLSVADRDCDFIVARLSNQRYGLIALHLMSLHHRTEWLWATWIHKSYAQAASKSIRFCDPFGGVGTDFPSPGLTKLLSGSLMELNNYALIGTQTDYESPLRLGNPLIEQDLVDKKQSSCIGCHHIARIGQKGGQTITAGTPPVGRPASLPASFVAYDLDFDYSLITQSTCYPSYGECGDTLSLAVKHKPAKNRTDQKNSAR